MAGMETVEVYLDATCDITVAMNAYKACGISKAQADVALKSVEMFAAPPLTSLRELQATSLQFEQHLNDEEHPDYAKWLAQLIAPGSSLGGARPKASVRDEKGASA
jgi:hypothetical protein